MVTVYDALVAYNIVVTVYNVLVAYNIVVTVYDALLALKKNMHIIQIYVFLVHYL